MAKTIETELGIEKQCTACGEFWPADKEFFYSAGNGRLMAQCIACCEERKRQRRREKEAICSLQK